jgi:non-specific serine/threonine protein kinase
MKTGHQSSLRRRRRRFSFAHARFDEGAWTLQVDGQVVQLEAKPAELLHGLLLRAGEVVTKDELLDLVWPGVHVVEASLSVAVSKLRRALGDEGGTIIETVPRIGYRLAAEVQVESLDAALPPRFAFAEGDAVPGRPQWVLDAPLGQSGVNDVWRARHGKTGETRVFKFADAPARHH